MGGPRTRYRYRGIVIFGLWLRRNRYHIICPAAAHRNNDLSRHAATVVAATRSGEKNAAPGEENNSVIADATKTKILLLYFYSSFPTRRVHIII